MEVEKDFVQKEIVFTPKAIQFTGFENQDFHNSEFFLLTISSCLFTDSS